MFFRIPWEKRLVLALTGFFVYVKVVSKILNSQIIFRDSEAGLKSAQNIIFQKIRNCYYLLGQYESSARKIESNTAKIIKDCRFDIYRELERVLQTKNRREIMLSEARASRRYWQAVSLICHAEKYWTRTQRHPADLLNQAINISYHWLCGECEKVLKEAGLFLDIGFLHSNNLKSPLAYDFMEQFRQPFADKVFIPLFSRKRKIDGENIAKIVVAKCVANLSKDLFGKESNKLKRCIINKMAYEGYRHKWGHN